MFQRILVPVDGSPLAERAVPVAARIARAAGGTLIFVRTLNIALEYSTYLGPVPVSQSLIDAAYADAQTYLTALTERDDVAGLTCETALLSGPAPELLLAAAESHRADLIVLNSHGRSGVARWVLGSVAEHVVHHASVPVLVLRTGEQPPAPEVTAAGQRWRAVVSLDGSPLAEAALDPAMDLVRALADPERASMRLVRVIKPLPALDDELALVLGDEQRRREAHAQAYHDAEAYLRAIADRLRAGPAAPAISPEVIEAPDAAAALIEAAERTDSGDGQAPAAIVMAMATHGRGGLARWTLGSVTARVLEGSRRPLLIVRPAAIVARQQPAHAEPAQVPASSSLRRTAPLFPSGTHGQPT